MQHSKVVGGSTAKRVIHCPGSVALVAKMPPQPSSKYAEEGTLLHGCMEDLLAGGDMNDLIAKHKLTDEQVEKLQFCLKALEYGASSAYMGLYFIHAGTDVAKALGYLKQYVGTKPQDSVPYVLLGEAAYAQRNYADAKAYLQEAKKVARGKSANVDWLLFQASFLTGDYSLASTMLDSSFAQGKTVGDLKALVSADTRFAEIGKRSEFRKYMNILNGTTTAKNYLKS